MKVQDAGDAADFTLEVPRMRKAKPKHRVIVVEDDRTSRTLICRILRDAGYDVIECTEGRDGLHMAEMNPPRAMVIDVMLPDMQGTQIAEEISFNSDCRFTKCLFLTGILSKKPRGKNYYFEIGERRYRALPKPIRKSLLLRHLASSIEASKELELQEKRAKELEEEERQALRSATEKPYDEELEGEAISLFEEDDQKILL